jgi:hypothetical protein
MSKPCLAGSREDPPGVIATQRLAASLAAFHSAPVPGDFAVRRIALSWLLKAGRRLHCRWAGDAAS